MQLFSNNANQKTFCAFEFFRQKWQMQDNAMGGSEEEEINIRSYLKTELPLLLLTATGK